MSIRDVLVLVLHHHRVEIEIHPGHFFIDIDHLHLFVHSLVYHSRCSWSDRTLLRSLVKGRSDEDKAVLRKKWRSYILTETKSCIEYYINHNLCRKRKSKKKLVVDVDLD